MAVGFNDQPDCALVEMDIPDTSDPPFAEETKQVKEPSGLRKTLKEKIGTVTSRILRLGSVQKHDSAVDSDYSDSGQQNEEFDGSETVVVDANNHYFFEEKALQLNLCVCNKGSEGIEDVSIKLGFPRIEDFDVVDRLYISPFDKRSEHGVRNLGYPDVEHCDDAIMVRSSIGTLTPDSPKQAFKCALRLAVGPRMQGKKLAIIYRLRGVDNQSLAKGRLKIKFGKVTT